MLEPRGDLDLAREPARDAGALRQHLLQRDGAAELGIERLDDAAHAAAPELGAEPIAIDGGIGGALRGGPSCRAVCFSGWNRVIDLVDARFDSDWTALA